VNKNILYRTAGPALILIALVPVSTFARRLPAPWGSVVLVGALLALVLIYANLDPNTYNYQCPHCKRSFKLSTKHKLLSMRIGQMRLLACPHCHKRGWLTPKE